ncbi:MAG: HD-GYP domain-containing protein [Planctomycetaceae bacterium]|nr:HD-GYP domain-containing protein [Planctomycetaceae bacterium]
MAKLAEDAATSPALLPIADRLRPADHRALELLEASFGVPFALVDGQSGELLFRSEGPPDSDWQLRGELCRVVARRGRPEIIQDEEPFAVLAVPLGALGSDGRVAVSTFVVRPVQRREDVVQAAQVLGMPAEAALEWAAKQVTWARPSLERVARMTLDHGRALCEVRKSEAEIESVSQNLANTYEEISLIYRITHNLRISRSDEELGRLALKWLADVVPARALALQMLPRQQEDQASPTGARSEPRVLFHGDSPLDEQEFVEVLDRLALRSTSQPVVLNATQATRSDWQVGRVRQLVVVPLTEGDKLLGHLAALNHVEDLEFGTVEASLLNSVAAILSIHSSNIELYRQQRELLEGIIRALISSIDAKDPYTCGHSDRVARISVRLAQQLECDASLVEAIYLSGLLHDIGKIGIDDAVLRKPGKLTDEEYEHIKTHVTVGHRILRDLRKLDEVLPVVLHHHESWDGKGYPGRLGAEEIPLSARIVAVADAYDAMASNRPYRQGMPMEKIESIFRSGAGQQWDPAIVGALMDALDDIQQISQSESVQAPSY